MSKRKRIVLPVAVVVVSLVITALLVQARPPVEKKEAKHVAPLVRVVEVQPETMTLEVSSRGTVSPRRESTLVAEVAGKIVQTSENLATGAFVKRGETLVLIEPADYELALAQAEASVAQAEVRLSRERAEAEIARREWTELGRGEEAPALVLREPQLADAEASLAAARATVDRAKLNLTRTALRAPFDGRVRVKLADLGQFVAPGTPIVSIYASDWVEVSVPVPGHELAYVDLPAVVGGAELPVTVEAEFAGARQEWTGRVIRTGSQIDPVSRMLDLIVRIDEPFSPRVSGLFPLQIGMFVDARIQGRVAEGVFVVPRAALRGEETLLVIDSESRLRFREVDVLRREKETVIVSSGLSAGDLVCVSPMETPVDGMLVRIFDEDEGSSALRDTP